MWGFGSSPRRLSDLRIDEQSRLAGEGDQLALVLKTEALGLQVSEGAVSLDRLVALGNSLVEINFGLGRADLVARIMEQIDRAGQAEVNLGGRPFVIGREFERDVAAANLVPAIAGLKRALLVMHAPLDAIVGVQNATEIFWPPNIPKALSRWIMRIICCRTRMTQITPPGSFRHGRRSIWTFGRPHRLPVRPKGLCVCPRLTLPVFCRM